MSRSRLRGALRFAPPIIMLGLASGIMIHSFGGDIIDGINSIRYEHELEDNNDETTFEIPVFMDVVEEGKNALDNIPSEEGALDGENEEAETTEIPPVEEQPHLSDELLTSGYEFQNIDFDELKEVNGDIDAWIEIQGTNINYPIMYAPDKDNPSEGEYYYLHHDRYGNESKSGEIFLYSGNKSLNNDQEDISAVSLIYGHHMRGAKMFAQVFNYVNQSYYDEHPFAVIYTPDGFAYKVSFFAGIISGPKTSESIDVSTEELFDEYIANAKENSTFESDIEVNYGDKIMILNTCEYTGGNNSKYLLYGVVEKEYTNELQIGTNDEEISRRLR